MLNLQNIGMSAVLNLVLKMNPKKLNYSFRDNFYKTNANNFFRDRKWYDGFLSITETVCSNPQADNHLGFTMNFQNL